MKQYTQQEFDNFPVINGRKQCPSGDYTLIRSFGERCSFGEWCSFGEGCSFGERCSFGELCSFGDGCSFENGHKANEVQFIRVNNIGSRGDGCYIYNFKDGVYVRSGCFFGTETEFVSAVENKHAGIKYETQYKLALQLAKVTF